MSECPECKKTVPGSELVLRPMVGPMRDFSRSEDLKVDHLTPRVCRECHDKMDTLKHRL
jgi:hypothetical protein